MLSEPGMICELEKVIVVRTDDKEIYLVDQHGQRFVIKSKTPISVEPVTDYFFYHAYRSKISSLVVNGEYVKVLAVKKPV